MQKKILIVDDNRNIVIPLTFIMERAGHLVQCAQTGEEALVLLPQFRPDLLLLDVVLPGMDGFDVCQQMRDNPEWAEILIVMLTVKGRGVEVEKGMALGANAYITKPFSSQELLGEIDRLFSAQEARP